LSILVQLALSTRRQALNVKTNALFVYLVTTARLGTSMVTDCVQLGTTVRTELNVTINTPVLPGPTQRNKEPKVSWTVKIAHQATTVKRELRNLWLAPRVLTML